MSDIVKNPSQANSTNNAVDAASANNNTNTHSAPSTLTETSSPSPATIQSTIQSNNAQLSIGSTVRITSRVRIGDDKFETISRRAIVATFSESDCDEDQAQDHQQQQQPDTNTLQQQLKPQKQTILSLVIDDLAPRPLIRILKNRGASNFMIAPMFHSRGIQVEEQECSLDDVMELLPFEKIELEDVPTNANTASNTGGSFTTSSSSSSCNAVAAEQEENETIRTLLERYKSYADQLFQIRDYTSSISYYEAALSLISSKSTSCFSIGSACVVKRNGNAFVAEVDCVDMEDVVTGSDSAGASSGIGGGGGGNVSYDVTLVKIKERKGKKIQGDGSGREDHQEVQGVVYEKEEEEDTISHRDVILSIWKEDYDPRVLGQRGEGKSNADANVKNDTPQFLQIKILLNLCRCLLKLADVDYTRGRGSCYGESSLFFSSSSSNSNRREKYRLASVLGCTTAITLCQYYHHHLSSISFFSNNNQHQQQQKQQKRVLQLQQELNTLQQKALLLRAHAYFGLPNKLRHAQLDIKKILTCFDPTHRQARELQRQIKKMEQYNKTMNKRLSKEVCRWVEKATMSGGEGERVLNSMDDDRGDRRESSGRRNSSSTGSERGSFNGSHQNGSNVDSINDSVSSNDTDTLLDSDIEVEMQSHGEKINRRLQHPQVQWQKQENHPLLSTIQSWANAFLEMYSWVPRRKIDVEVLSVFGFLVAMWVVYPSVSSEESVVEDRIV